jgi:hypothetical protein
MNPYLSSRTLRHRLLAGSLLLLAATLAPARDAFVLISGGGTPLSNHYSQYLQAKEMTAHLQKTYPADSVWVFFGIGNREGETAKLADVHRQVKRDGLLLDTWVPGPLPRNRPARKAEILQALREEILPAVHDGGTLYLFIGDHGSLAKKEPKESVVTLWQLENPSGGDRGWRTNPEEELSVTTLREALAAGLGRGKVVFCMTQCHSGGFHYLGVPRAVAPDQAWFTAVPEWAAPLDEAPPPVVAGFTSVDEESLAAGCDPDPDPDSWAGYERFVPEFLLGVNLFDGRRTGAGLTSYAAAHAASVLVDQTIDKPRTSSEQFLERWATLIEQLGADPSLLTAGVKAQVADYQQAVDTGFASAADAAFAARRTQFRGFQDRMMAQNPAAADLLQKGTRAELDRAIGPKETPGGSGSRPGGAASAPTERSKLWNEIVRPAWQAAVAQGSVPELPAEAREFESYLLAAEGKGRDFMFARGWQNPMLNDLYWQSGYAWPAKLDERKAEAVVRWGAERRQKIMAWAKASPDAAVKAAGEKLAPPARPKNAAAPLPPPRTLSRKIAAERTLFYRRTLAAWSFLLAVHADDALAQLHRLMELEETALPAA